MLADALARLQATTPWDLQEDTALPSDHRKFTLALREHFSGKRPLWSAFWLVGALGFAATVLITMVLAELRQTAVPPFAVVTGLIQMVIWIGFSTLALASIWRCAYNVRWKVWGHLARAYVIGIVVLPLAIGVAALLLK